MKIAPLFKKIWPCQAPIIICQGGGDSAKTVSNLQKLALQSTQIHGAITTITGVDLPNLKGGVLRTFQRYVQNDVAHYISKYNESSTTYYFKNKSLIEFKSFENEQDARGSERDFLYVNEMNGIPYSMFWQLWRKTRRQTLGDYNPTSRFYAHDLVLPGPNQDKQFRNRVQLFITDHRHNPFLTEEEHQRYEDISDPDMFAVYSRGKTGKIKGLIFGHFKRMDQWITEDTSKDRIFWGIDYGYTNDPTAIVKIVAHGQRTRYVKECCYEPGLSDQRIIEIFHANGFRDGQEIYSEADPDMINALRLKGLPVVPAIKGPGSIKAGIAKVRQYEVFYYSDFKSKINPEMTNFDKEIATYKFLEDEDVVTGKLVMINKPIDAWNHLCDATRYGIYTDSFRFPEHNPGAK